MARGTGDEELCSEKMHTTTQRVVRRLANAVQSCVVYFSSPPARCSRSSRNWVKELVRRTELRWGHTFALRSAHFHSRASCCLRVTYSLEPKKTRELRPHWRRPRKSEGVTSSD